VAAARCPEDSGATRIARGLTSTGGESPRQDSRVLASNPMSNVAFLGTGLMGAGMIERLRSVDVGVTAYNRTRGAS
jgi:hypothetical protein